MGNWVLTIPKCKQYWFCIAIIIMMQACTMLPPEDTKNICHIFKNHPDWYQASYHAEKRWGLPVYIQMAIMRYESHFDPEARPPREMVLGLFPGERPSTAYGFSQALDGTWAEYQQETNQYHTQRNVFADATDFMGWYAYKAREKANIKPTDAYNLYLAYHDGIQGYLKKSYRSKAWLVQVAKRVKTTAALYKDQLASCTRKH